MYRVYIVIYSGFMAAKVLLFFEICKRKMHKIAEKDEETELSLLVRDVIKSGYNPDEMDGGYSLTEIESTGHYSAGHRRALDRREQRDIAEH